MDHEDHSSQNKFLNRSRTTRNILFFILSLIAALILTHLLGAKSFSESQNYVLFLLFFSIGLWLTEAIPPFAVGLFIMAYLFFMLGNSRFNSQPQNTAKYLHTFSNSIIWLMLGGFFLAEAMTKTGIDANFFRFTLRVSGKIPKNILLGVMLTTMIASMLLSNTAVSSMMIAAMMPLLTSLKGKSFGKALLLGIPLAASFGGMGTIIGSPPNAIAVGELENNGILLSFPKWMIFGIPLSFLFTIAGWYFLQKKFIKENEPVNVELAVHVQEGSPEQNRQRIIVMIILIVTVSLWLTSAFHRLSVAMVAAIPLVFLPMTGILQGADMRKMPWDTLLLVAGGLSLGLALQETHLLEHFSKHITGTEFGSTSILLVFGYATMLFSNIMSNTATSTILIPLGIYLMPQQAMQIAVTIALAASTALLLPVSTPPNAIAYSTGMIKQKDFLPTGALAGLLGPLLIVLFVKLLV
jgi:sodium-dependent dicarboxylate transporter 2/3/5